MGYNISMNKFFLVDLTGMPILEQLRLEEALLRADKGNWCLINTSSPDAIVMGISGKLEQLIDRQRVKERSMPIIKRFSGGGTVYIDPNTIFVTLIANQKCTQVPCLPKEVMQWSEGLYEPFFNHPDFALRENDYVFAERKFGGNAQYMQKGRWLHHTSFLWDFDPQKMQSLLLPQKRPTYREARTHEDFLTSLNKRYPNKELFFDSLKKYLLKTLEASEVEVQSAQAKISMPHRKATTLVDY